MMIIHVVKPFFLVMFALLFIFASKPVVAQDEFFHEIVIEKKLIENEEWELNGEANFKNLYDEHGWRRWGASFIGIKKMNRFRFLGGLNGFYTFNSNITNFFELRPWTALQYNIPIAANLTLRQRLKYEWRFFHTEGNNSTRENYRRLRYQIGFDIPLTGEEEASWSIRPYFEWFFIRDPATFERFPNERDYGITVFKRLENEHELFFSYRLETFYNTDTNRRNGHLFLIGYTF